MSAHVHETQTADGAAERATRTPVLRRRLPTGPPQLFSTLAHHPPKVWGVGVGREREKGRGRVGNKLEAAVGGRVKEGPTLARLGIGEKTPLS